MKVFLFIFIGIRVLCSDGFCQSQNTKLFLYNIGFGGFATGLGRAINKEKDQKFFGQFWKGFQYGCIGGTINYGSKRLAYSITNNRNLIYAWPCKLVHSYGSSVMENAALHRNPFASIRIPVGFTMIELEKKEKLKVHVRFMPASFGQFLFQLTKDKYDWNVKRSLQAGTLYMEYKEAPGQYKDLGFAVNNFIFINKSNPYYYWVVTHELVHGFQYREHLVFNSYLQKPYKRVLTKTKSGLLHFADKYVYPDMPYFNLLFYPIAGIYHDYRDRFRNWYEFEAQRFATNQYVQRY